MTTILKFLWRSVCSLCAPGESTVIISWDKSQWCVMVSLLWLAFSPTVRPGSLLHYLKSTPPQSQPLNRRMFPFFSEKLLICVYRRGEHSSKLKQNVDVDVGPPMEKVAGGGFTRRSFVGVSDCAEQTGAPRRPRHALPDGALLSERTEVYCSQCCSAITLSCVGRKPSTQKHQAGFDFHRKTQSEGINDNKLNLFNAKRQ